MKIVTKILLIVAFFALSVEASGLNKEAIVDKMIEVYGGEALLWQVSSYDQVWEIDRKTDNKKGVDYREVTLPDYLRTKLIYTDKIEIRTLLKNKGEKEVNGKKKNQIGPMLEAMKLQLMRLYSPIILKKQIRNITLSVSPTYYELSLAKGTSIAKYFVSKKSFLVEKVIGTLKVGKDTMEFKTLYQDYRNIHGLMLAHKEIKYASDINTAVMSLKDMKVVRATKEEAPKKTEAPKK